MPGLRIRIGGDGPVVVESDAKGWRLIARGHLYASGVYPGDLHRALRDLALGDRDLARVSFGDVCNCAGAWEDEYTEEHGEDALTLEDWMQRIEYGGDPWVSDDRELMTSVPNHEVRPDGDSATSPGEGLLHPATGRDWDELLLRTELPWRLNELRALRWRSDEAPPPRC